MAEYGVYKAIQEKNNHVWIFENERAICHVPCYKRKTDEELIDLIKSVLVLRDKYPGKKKRGRL